MEESPMPLPLPIILGRPFIRTADTKICVKKGIVSMKVNGEKIEFKIFDALKLPQDDMEYINVCMVQVMVEEVFQVQHIDPMEATHTHSLTKANVESEFVEVTKDITKAIHLLEASPKYPSTYTPPLKLLLLPLSRHQIWN
jgi:hypothetical protein